MDEIDQRLLSMLAEDARQPAAMLARRLGLARSTVQARIERLERTGMIAGYTLRPGPALQPALRATVLISIEPRAGSAVLARLKAMPEVESVHTTSGRVDLIASLAARDTEELDAALERIGEARGVRGSESLIHLSTKFDRRR